MRCSRKRSGRWRIHNAAEARLVKRGEGTMQHIGKSKVTKLKAKAGVVYPLIRLPKTCADEIGKVAKIFEPQHHNRRALLATFNDGEGLFEVIQLESKVIQLLPKVIQPEGLNNAESRLSALESQIAELKSLLLENENQKAPQSPLFRQSTPANRWARPDSNRRPPPCEDEDLALAPLFLDRSEVFLDRFADDTTTTNASAPS